MVMILSYRICARLGRRSTLRSRYKPGMPSRIDDPSISSKPSLAPAHFFTAGS
ncbi:hypothetical protein ASPFODRAFT_54300, partial [Aspergillus luchuensis CBS 106.47]